MKKKIKLSSVIIYVVAFVLLISVVSFGYQSPQKQATAETGSSSDLSQYIVQPTPDNIVAANVAADVAQVANLSVVGEVQQNADSMNILGGLANSNATDTSQPPILALSDVSREITYYTTVDGDTVDTVAAKFHISTDTLRWANNYTNSVTKLGGGKTLKILPRNGILYVVRSGDTADSIASKYQANSQEIITYNDLEISGVKAGLQIIVPDGVLPATERPGYVNYSTYPSLGFSGGFGGPFAPEPYYDGGNGVDGNPYARWNCTAWAYHRRAELLPNSPVGVHWGDAWYWKDSALPPLYKLTNSPRIGSILVQRPDAFSRVGHVAVVEGVNDDGSIVVSEENAQYHYTGVAYNGGRANINVRYIPASSASSYLYIY